MWFHVQGPWIQFSKQNKKNCPRTLTDTWSLDAVKARNVIKRNMTKHNRKKKGFITKLKNRMEYHQMQRRNCQKEAYHCDRRP